MEGALLHSGEEGLEPFDDPEEHSAGNGGAVSKYVEVGYGEDFCHAVHDENKECGSPARIISCSTPIRVRASMVWSPPKACMVVGAELNSPVLPDVRI